jgi:hypothetical protein
MEDVSVVDQHPADGRRLVPFPGHYPLVTYNFSNNRLQVHSSATADRIPRPHQVHTTRELSADDTLPVLASTQEEGWWQLVEKAAPVSQTPPQVMLGFPVIQVGTSASQHQPSLARMTCSATLLESTRMPRHRMEAQEASNRRSNRPRSYTAGQLSAPPVRVIQLPSPTKQHHVRLPGLAKPCLPATAQGVSLPRLVERQLATAAAALPLTHHEAAANASKTLSQGLSESAKLPQLVRRGEKLHPDDELPFAPAAVPLCQSIESSVNHARSLSIISKHLSELEESRCGHRDCPLILSVPTRQVSDTLLPGDSVVAPLSPVARSVALQPPLLQLPRSNQEDSLEAESVSLWSGILCPINTNTNTCTTSDETCESGQGTAFCGLPSYSSRGMSIGSTSSSDLSAITARASSLRHLSSTVQYCEPAGADQGQGGAGARSSPSHVSASASAARSTGTNSRTSQRFFQPPSPTQDHAHL